MNELFIMSINVLIHEPNIAGFGSCALNLIFSETLYRVFICHPIGDEDSCHVTRDSLEKLKTGPLVP